jgi:hypothetical protein
MQISFQLQDDGLVLDCHAQATRAAHLGNATCWDMSFGQDDPFDQHLTSDLFTFIRTALAPIA